MMTIVNIPKITQYEKDSFDPTRYATAKIEDKMSITLDLFITIDLQEEGLLNEIMRVIQNSRKTKGFQSQDKLTLFLAGTDAQIYYIVKKYDSDIIKRCNLNEISINDIRDVNESEYNKFSVEEMGEGLSYRTGKKYIYEIYLKLK